MKTITLSAVLNPEDDGYLSLCPELEFISTFDLPTNGAWADVDLTADGDYNKFLFLPEDASGNPSTFLNGYIWMDDVTLTTTPDAANTGVLLGAALGGMAYLRRRLA